MHSECVKPETIHLLLCVAPGTHRFLFIFPYLLSFALLMCRIRTCWTSVMHFTDQLPEMMSLRGIPNVSGFTVN